MRRTVPVVALTAGTLALLSQFHTSPLTLIGAPSPATPPGTYSDQTTTRGRSTAPTTPTQTTPTRTTPPRTTPTRTATSPTRTTPTRPTPTAGATPGATRQVDGPIVTTRYGGVQVEIVIKGHQLLDVRALQLPGDRSRSVRISSQAGPLLRSEALQAQSANIQMVSGASYTSAGYQQSLQAALDQANW
jgi:uncharacterized protein with FMN-binding domain